MALRGGYGRRRGWFGVRVIVAGLVALMAGLAAGCGTAETRVDPGELEIRDLLGIDPEVAAGWDASERASARAVLARAFTATAAVGDRGEPLGLGSDPGEAVAASLSALDEELQDEHAGPWILVDVTVVAAEARAHAVVGRGVSFAVDAPTFLTQLDGILAPGESPRLQRAPRAPFAAANIAGSGLLLVNPVVLAALEPDPARPIELIAPLTTAPVAVEPPRPRPAKTEPTPTPIEPLAGPGNPYAFYGSVGECAAAEQDRCQACLPTSTCKPETRDTTDGNQECMMLAANGGVGYSLLCINYALAIATVSDCVTTSASACAQATSAGNQLGEISANQDFLSMPACQSALDTCLAALYGAPSQTYPTPGSDAGPTTTPPPPRDVTVACGSCNNNFDCNFSPQCSGCTGGNCSSPSCQSGNCSSGSCSKTSVSSGSGCNTGCSSSTSSGGSGCGSTSCGSSTSSSSGCGSGCSSSSSSSGSSCGSCGSSSSSSSSSSCSGSGSKCDVAAAPPPQIIGVAVTFGWAVLPLGVLAVWRRRERRRATSRGGQP